MYKLGAASVVHNKVYIKNFVLLKASLINHLKPELNPSTQRCLTRFFTGDFASCTVHFLNIRICVKTNKYTNYSLIRH
jgi:hypothetical protein